MQRGLADLRRKRKHLNNPKLDDRQRRKHEYYTLSGEEVGITEIHSTMPALNLSA